MGQLEEFSPKGRQRYGSAGRSGQCDGGLSRGEAVKCDARIEDGPRCKDGTQSKGKEAKLSYNGNRLVENRNGLIVKTEVFEANGTAERDAALVMLEQIPVRDT